MSRESIEMDSLFEGMEFVMPLEDEARFLVGGHNLKPISLKEKEVGHEGWTPRAPSLPARVAVPTVTSSSSDLTSPFSRPAVGLSRLPSHCLPSLPSTQEVHSPSFHGNIPHTDPNEPLDEGLFSGLTISSLENETAEFNPLGACEAPKPDTTRISSTDVFIETSVPSIGLETPLSFDLATGTGNCDRDGASMEGMMAGYIDVSPYLVSLKYTSGGSPRTSESGLSSASPAAKPFIRRKRRSMKIGYGREEEENEELLLRKLAIRDALGGALVGKESVCASSTSIPRQELSRGSGGGALYFDNLVFKPSLSEECGLLNDLKLGTEILNGRTPTSQCRKLEVLGIDRVASRESLDEDGCCFLNEPASRLTLPKIADRSKQDVPCPRVSHSVETEEENVEVEVAADSSRASPKICSSYVENVLAETKDDEVGDADSLDLKVDDMDILLFTQERDGTIAERLEYVKEAVALKMNVLQEKSSVTSARSKAALQKRRKAAEKVATASTKCKELEAELDAACEREDFEKAEALTGSISEAENNLAQAAEAFTVAEAESESASLTVLEVLDLQVATEERGAIMLELLKLEAADAAETVLREALQSSSQEMERLVAEERLIELRKENLDAEFKQVENANAELSRVVEDLTKSECKAKGALIEKQSQLHVEFQDLIALMRLKEAEITECNKHITTVEKKMSSLVATFENQKIDLDTKLETLAASALQLEKDFNLFSAEKQVVLQSVADAEQKSLRLKKIATLAQDAGMAMQEAVEIKRAAAVVTLQSRKKRADLGWEEKRAQSETQLLRLDALSTGVLLQELTSMKVKLSQELSAIKEHAIFVEKRGPELDAEKKQAAAARNFKVAGRLAAEAKVLTAEKESASADMARILKELEKVEAEAEIKLIVMTDLKNLLTAKEREAAMARCERLQLVAAAARDERDVAIGREDWGEAESLDLEAKAAESEVEELHRLYKLEGRDSRILGNSKVREEGADSKGYKAAMAERLRQVAAAARAEGHTAVELDQFEEAEEFVSKARPAEALANKIQRLYQVERRQFESERSSIAASENAD